MIFLAVFRCFSRNIYKRQAENAKYLKVTTKIRQFFKRQKNRIKYRKTKVYKKCPSCKNILCLPRKKGRHTVKCPSCSHRFDIKIWLTSYLYWLFRHIIVNLGWALKPELRFGNADFRSSFVKILGNTYSISCVLCLGWTKIRSFQNLRPQSEEISRGFCFDRAQ